MKAVTVIGMGDEGCLGLSSIAANAVSKAQVLAGGERHLDFFPNFRGKKSYLRKIYHRRSNESPISPANIRSVYSLPEILFFSESET